MVPRRLFLIVALVAALVAGACSQGTADEGELVRQAGAPPDATTPEPDDAAPPADDGATNPAEPPAAVVTPSGVIVPVLASAAPETPDGAAPDSVGYLVRTPCGNEATISAGTPVARPTVVLDPGHGGIETGAVGPNGLVERDLNLLVADRTRAHLEAAGETVVLTRTADYRVTLQVRGELVRALAPRAFVSVHHNGGGDHLTDQPGTEVFFQVADPESRRLAGLVYEEVFDFFSTLPVPEGFQWEADYDAGVKPRLNTEGGDYYGILRHTAGVPAALSEAAYLSHGAEAELLARDDVQEGEAQALTRAIRRFLTTDDPGTGFVEPYERTEPAGPGGGTQGCVDPPLE